MAIIVSELPYRNAYIAPQYRACNQCKTRSLRNLKIVLADIKEPAQVGYPTLVHVDTKPLIYIHFPVADICLFNFKKNTFVYQGSCLLTPKFSHATSNFIWCHLSFFEHKKLPEHLHTIVCE